MGRRRFLPQVSFTSSPFPSELHSLLCFRSYCRASRRLPHGLGPSLIFVPSETSSQPPSILTFRCHLARRSYFDCWTAIYASLSSTALSVTSSNLHTLNMALLSAEHLAGPGYIILNVMRGLNIIALASVVASSVVMLVKTFIISKVGLEHTLQVTGTNTISSSSSTHAVTSSRQSLVFSLSSPSARYFAPSMLATGLSSVLPMALSLWAAL